VQVPSGDCAEHNHNLQIRKKFRATGSNLNSKITRSRHVLTEEKLDETGAILEISRRKPLVQRA